MNPYPEAWVDQFGNFDYVDTIAGIIVNMVRKNSSGLYNVGTDLKSIYELAKQTQANPKKIFSPAHVPKNQSMNLDKFFKKCKNQ
jgi:dTDP-4-dehydrorhamnose reductase